MQTLRYLPDVVTLELDAAECNGCMVCVEVCPHAVFAIRNKRAVIVDRDACMECGACANNCSEGALTVRAGVGCAWAIIKGSLLGTEPTCDDGGGSACGG